MKVTNVLTCKTKYERIDVTPRGFGGIIFTLGFLAAKEKTFTDRSSKINNSTFRFLGDRFEYGLNGSDIVLSNLRFSSARSTANRPDSLSKMFVRRSAQSFVSMYGRGASVGSLSFRSVLGIARVMSRYNGKLARNTRWWGPYAHSITYDFRTNRERRYSAAPYASAVTPLGRNGRSALQRYEIRQFRRVASINKLWRTLKQQRPRLYRDRFKYQPVPLAMHRTWLRAEAAIARDIFLPSQYRSRSHRTEFNVRYHKVGWAGVNLRYKGLRRFPRHWDKTFRHVTVRSQQTKWFSRRQGSTNWRIHSRKFGAFRTGSMYGGSVAYVAGVASGSAWARGFKFSTPHTKIFIRPTTHTMMFHQCIRVRRGNVFHRSGKNTRVANRVAIRIRMLFHRARARVHALLASANNRWGVLGTVDPAEKNMSVYRLLTYCGFSTVNWLRTAPLRNNFVSASPKRNLSSPFARADHVGLVYDLGLKNGRGHRLNRWFAFIRKKRDKEALGIIDSILIQKQAVTGGLLGIRYKKSNLPFTYRNKVVTSAETYLARGIISQAQTAHSRRFSDLLMSSFSKDTALAAAMWGHVSRAGLVYNEHTPGTGYLWGGDSAPFYRQTIRSEVKNAQATPVSYPNNPRGYLASLGEFFSPTLPAVAQVRSLPCVAAKLVPSEPTEVLSSRSWVGGATELVNSRSAVLFLKNAALGHVLPGTVRRQERLPYFGYLSGLNIQENRVMWYLGQDSVRRTLQSIPSPEDRLKLISAKKARRLPKDRTVIKDGRTFMRLIPNFVPPVRALPSYLSSEERARFRMSRFVMLRNISYWEMVHVLSAKYRKPRYAGARWFRQKYKNKVMKRFMLKRLSRHFRWNTTCVRRNSGFTLLGHPGAVYPTERRVLSDLLLRTPAKISSEVQFAVAAHLAQARGLASAADRVYPKKRALTLRGSTTAFQSLRRRVLFLTRKRNKGALFRAHRSQVRHRLTGMSRTHRFTSGLTIPQLRLQRRVDSVVGSTKGTRLAFSGAIVPTLRSGASRLKSGCSRVLRETEKCGSFAKVLGKKNGKLGRSRKARRLNLATGLPIGTHPVISRFLAIAHKAKNNIDWRNKKNGDVFRRKQNQGKRVSPAPKKPRALGQPFKKRPTGGNATEIATARNRYKARSLPTRVSRAPATEIPTGTGGFSVSTEAPLSKKPLGFFLTRCRVDAIKRAKKVAKKLEAEAQVKHKIALLASKYSLPGPRPVGPDGFYILKKSQQNEPRKSYFALRREEDRARALEAGERRPSKARQVKSVGRGSRPATAEFSGVRAPDSGRG